MFAPGPPRVELSLDLDHLVETHQLENTAHSATWSNDDQLATELLDPVVHVQEAAGSGRIHERRSSDVEPEPSALPGESARHGMFQRRRARNVQFAGGVQGLRCPVLAEPEPQESFRRDGTSSALHHPTTSQVVGWPGRRFHAQPLEHNDVAGDGGPPLLDGNDQRRNRALASPQSPDRVFPSSEGGEHLPRMPKSVRVALVNDYEIVLEGLRALLRAYEPEIRVVELDVEAKPKRAVDVTLFDTYGELHETRQRARDLAADAANGAVIVFSFSDNAAFADTYLDAGAQGFISKGLPANQIVEGIRAAAQGETVMLVRRSQHGTTSPELRWPGRDAGLTVRESELLALLPTGMTNRELGDHLHLSENTIKSQLRGLFSKLEVRNRVQAVALVRTGFLGESHSRSSTD